MTQPQRMDDWSEYDTDDNSLKTKIPECLNDGLNEMAERLGMSKSDLARNALMVHVHGRLTFDRLVTSKQWRTSRRRRIPDDRKFCRMGADAQDSDEPRRTAYINAFGKSTCDLEVWMPQSLRQESARLAHKAKVSESEYLRRVLTAYYLGRVPVDALVF